MNLRALRDRILQQDDLNFLLTNRVPRIALTRFMGWFSQIEQPWVRDASIAVWRMFTELDLSDAKKQQFKSLHDCFTRELKAGARTIDADPALLVSPCDAIVGACGAVEDARVLQTKGFAYTLDELFANPELAHVHCDGVYATLRLTSSMYHRFHAPHDCRITKVTYISGDTWNVNPIALKRVTRLFCRNERAVIQTQLRMGGHLVTLVPVAAVLVASIRLHCIDVLLHLKYRGPSEIRCDACYAKGDEMGWFQHGSTIIVFAPAGFSLCDDIREGARVQMGKGLMQVARRRS